MIITPYTAGKRKTDNLILRVSERPIRSQTTQLLSGLPGFWRWEGWNVVFRPTMANVEYLLQHWPDANWSEGTAHYTETFRAAQVENERINRLKVGQLPPMSKDGYNYKRLPRDQQRRALLVSWNKKAFALLMEQRTGKTKVVIDNAAQLYKLGLIHTLIIVTIKGVHRNWIENEIPEDLPDWVRRECYFTRSANTVKNQRQFERVRDAKGRALRIFAFNIESFGRLKNGSRFQDQFEEVLGDGQGVFLAIDESSCIKNYASNCTKYILKHAATAEWKRILNGTPAPEGRPDELYPQYTFLDENILGYDTVTTFRARYSETRPLKLKDDEGNAKRTIDKIVPGCKNVAELQAKMAPHSFRVLRRDCMDLPPKIYKRWPVDLTATQEKLYNELRDEYIAEFRGHTVSAMMAMTRLMRLQQIVCNWWPMEESQLLAGETWKNVRPIEKANPRLEALKDILETHEGKTIIWARFRPDLEAIQAMLGKRAVSYHGGIKDDQRASNYKGFQQRPEIEYFVANPASAGLGLTLTAATQEVYYSNSYSLRLRLQSEDRPEGPGKKDSTLIIDMESIGTVDSKIIKALKKKKDISDLINADPRALFMEEDI